MELHLSKGTVLHPPMLHIVLAEVGMVDRVVTIIDMTRILKFSAMILLAFK
jgi:hypothetical protein